LVYHYHVVYLADLALTGIEGKMFNPMLPPDVALKSALILSLWTFVPAASRCLCAER